MQTDRLKRIQVLAAGVGGVRRSNTIELRRKGGDAAGA